MVLHPIKELLLIFLVYVLPLWEIHIERNITSTCQPGLSKENRK